MIDEFYEKMTLADGDVDEAKLATTASTTTTTTNDDGDSYDVLGRDRQRPEMCLLLYLVVYLASSCGAPQFIVRVSQSNVTKKIVSNVALRSWCDATLWNVCALHHTIHLYLQ